VPRDVATTLRASSADVRAMMALLASITLFAAAFLILNTLAMTVVERIRELGLLRAAGAGRGQVVRVVVTQALLLGTAGSVLGLALGALLAHGVAAGLRASGSVVIEAPLVAPEVLVAGFPRRAAVTVVGRPRAGPPGGRGEPRHGAARPAPIRPRRPGAGPLADRRGGRGRGVGLLLLPGGTSSPSAVVRTAAVYVVLLAAVLLTPVLLAPLGRVAGLPFALVLRL